MHLLVRCLYTTYYQRLANVCYISVYNLATIVNNIHIYGISHLCIRTCRIHFKDTLVHFSFAINKIRFYITSRRGLIRIIFSTFLVIGFLLFPGGVFLLFKQSFYHLVDFLYTNALAEYNEQTRGKYGNVGKFCQATFVYEHGIFSAGRVATIRGSVGGLSPFACLRFTEQQQQQQ